MIMMHKMRVTLFDSPSNRVAAASSEQEVFKAGEQLVRNATFGTNEKEMTQK